MSEEVENTRPDSKLMLPQNQGQGTVERINLISKFSPNSFQGGMLTDKQSTLSILTGGSTSP